MENIGNWAERFEPIGDNCEFGFVQRLAGFDEGSLLKWCRIMNHKHLVAHFALPLEDFYRFENLKPIYEGMLVDKASDVIFHTELYSGEVDGVRRFNGDEEHQARVYKAEYDKRIHLYKKFQVWAKSGSKIFVYKMNGQDDCSHAEEIADALNRRGSNCKLLYVTDAQPSRAGEVERINSQIFKGYVSRFAPYWEATNVEFGDWERVCKATLLMNDR